MTMPGYTHLQPAQPITFGYYLLGVAYALERDWQRISECFPRIASTRTLWEPVRVPSLLFPLIAK